MDLSGIKLTAGASDDKDDMGEVLNSANAAIGTLTGNTGSSANKADSDSKTSSADSASSSANSSSTGDSSASNGAPPRTNRQHIASGFIFNLGPRNRGGLAVEGDVLPRAYGESVQPSNGA